MSAPATPLVPRTIFLIATEESGDRLGASLMQMLRERLGGDVRFEGVGGVSMKREGLTSLFPIEELSIMGFSAVARRLPLILRRIRETAAAVLMADPDALVIIDSPDFTHRVARRVRVRNPSIPIVDYVSPSVWAWRPGRARAMRAYIDHVLALLPFEPEIYRRLLGPPCTYVGHPLIEQIATLRPNLEESIRRDRSPPILLVLPGSRRSEIHHHMEVFGDCLAALRSHIPQFEVVLPTMPHLVGAVSDAVESWPLRPTISVSESDKRKAFRVARAALTKSGTVTLELAIAGVPMVAAYRGGAVEAWIARRLVRSSTMILANLVIGENVVPEFLQDDCAADKIAPTLAELMTDSPLRQRQLDAFAGIDELMAIGSQSPSAKATDIVLGSLRAARSGT